MTARTNALVLSDTHMPSRARKLPERVLAALREADLILHAGDLTTPALLDELRQYGPVYAVGGNVDDTLLQTRLPRRLIVPVGKFKIGLVHGHGAVGSTIERAAAAFVNESVDCVVFGHSHQPLLKRRDDRIFLNPGSPTDKRGQPNHSFAWLRAGETLDPEIIYYDGPGVKEMR